MLFGMVWFIFVRVLEGKPQVESQVLEFCGKLIVEGISSGLGLC